MPPRRVMLIPRPVRVTAALRVCSMATRSATGLALGLGGPGRRSWRPGSRSSDRAAPTSPVRDPDDFSIAAGRLRLLSSLGCQRPSALLEGALVQAVLEFRRSASASAGRSYDRQPWPPPRSGHGRVTARPASPGLRPLKLVARVMGITGLAGAHRQIWWDPVRRTEAQRTSVQFAHDSSAVIRSSLSSFSRQRVPVA